MLICILTPRLLVCRVYADESFALERTPRIKAKVAIDHRQIYSPGGNLSAVIESLPSLQGPRGGFGKPHPSLVATSRALFLARLYGVMGQIDTKRAAEYVRTAATEAQVKPENVLPILM